MTREEFLKKWDRETLAKAGAFVDNKCTLDFTISCYVENGVWKIFQEAKV